MEKIDLRKASKESKEAIRTRAIRMHEQGLKQNKIAILLGVHKNSIYQWVELYKEQGSKGLKEVVRGRKKGDGKLLNNRQEKEIQRMIVDKMPDQLKLPYALWTRKAIVDLIKRTYKINLAIRTMGDYLNIWGFTLLKSLKKKLMGKTIKL